MYSLLVTFETDTPSVAVNLGDVIQRVAPFMADNVEIALTTDSGQQIEWDMSGNPRPKGTS